MATETIELKVDASAVAIQAVTMQARNMRANTLAVAVEALRTQRVGMEQHNLVQLARHGADAQVYPEQVFIGIGRQLEEIATELHELTTEAHRELDQLLALKAQADAEATPEQFARDVAQEEQRRATYGHDADPADREH